MLNNKGHVISFDDTPLQQNTPLDSIAYNKIIDSLKTSTLRCINRSRDLASKMSKLSKALTAENLYLASEVNQSQYTQVNETNTEVITGYDDIIDSSQIERDNLTGQVIIKPINKWSKVIRNLDRSGRNRASKDISISINGVVQPPDADIYNILDGYTDSFWIYDTIPDTNYTISISFPASIKPYINYLRLTPFPAFGYSIQSMDVIQADGSVFNLNTAIGSKLGIVDLHFKTISWGGRLDITVKANGNVIGIADLDLGLEDYYEVQNPNLVSYVVYELPGLRDKTMTALDYIDLTNFNLVGPVVDQSFNIATKIKGYFYIDTYDPSLPGTVISPDTFILNGLHGKASTACVKSINQKIYIKFTMEKYLSQTPVLQAVKVKYL